MHLAGSCLSHYTQYNNFHLNMNSNIMHISYKYCLFVINSTLYCICTNRLYFCNCCHFSLYIVCRCHSKYTMCSINCIIYTLINYFNYLRNMHHYSCKHLTHFSKHIMYCLHLCNQCSLKEIRMLHSFVDILCKSC